MLCFYICWKLWIKKQIIHMIDLTGWLLWQIALKKLTIATDFIQILPLILDLFLLNTIKHRGYFFQNNLSKQSCSKGGCYYLWIHHINSFISVLVTNVCMISTNYLVRWRNFSFPEVGLARGIIQFVVFGPVILHTCWKTRNDKAVLKRSKYSILYVIGYGVFIGSASAAITSAIHMMPIGMGLHLK